MTQTYEQVDPTTITIGDNVRLDPRLDKEFIASIRERGVLEPVLLYRAADGTLTVTAGQRRTLAAREARRTTIPAIVDDQPPSTADRLVDQYVENEHRAALTNRERITAIEQMALAGLSDHQIARRTATPKATVAAAKTAATADPAIRDLADQLTLDQAAVLAEFDDDSGAVDELLEAAQYGRFEHAAQRLRNDRADAAKRADYAAQLTAQGITVVDQPYYNDPHTAALTRLTDPDGNDLTLVNHADCPGHAAYVDTDWRHPDTLDETDQTVDNDLDEDDDPEDDAPAARRWQPPVQVLAPVYVCTDYQTHGHVDRWSATAARHEKKRAADMTDAERETARAERRHVIESNKAWKAATEVRRAWLADTFAHRKTAPAGAEVYLARTITEGWGHESADADALQLAGFGGNDDDTPGYLRAYTQRGVTVDAIAAATPKRALQIGLTVAVAMWETRTHPNSWRNHTEQTTYTLARLKEWGYPTSEIEDRMLAEAAAKHTDTDTH